MTAVLERAHVDFEVSSNAKLTSFGVSEGAGSAVGGAVQTDWLRPLPRRRVEEIFLDGILALQTVRQKHPAWFRGAIEYPEEDFSSPDFSGVEVELPDQLPTTFSTAPAPPAFPPGLILWAPVVWHPDVLYLLRSEAGSVAAAEVASPTPQKMPKGKLRAVDESKVADAWQAGAEEWLMVPAKLRPALVVSTAAEHQLRRVARLMPLYRTDDNKGFYGEHEAEIRAQDIPGLYWLDDVPIRRSAPQPLVVDCSRVVRFPTALLMGRKRIAVIDEVTLAALKQFWSESVLV